MLNKEKYKEKLESMLSDIIAVSKSGELGRCMDTVNCGNCLFYGYGCDEGAMDWLNSECKEPVLTEEEREYLSAVIEPFKKYVMYIAKLDFNVGWEKIVFYSQSFKTWECMTDLPPFQSGTRFKGMELNEHYYKLEELGL